MLHHRPENPVQFVQECLEELEKSGGQVRWNAFIDFEPSKEALGTRPCKYSRYFHCEHLILLLVLTPLQYSTVV